MSTIRRQSGMLKSTQNGTFNVTIKYLSCTSFCVAMLLTGCYGRGTVQQMNHSPSYAEQPLFWELKHLVSLFPALT